MTWRSGLTAEDLDHGAAEIAGEQLEPAIRLERLRDGRQHAVVEAFAGTVAPGDGAGLVEHRLGRVGGEAVAPDRLDVLVQEAGLEQLADHESHAAGGMEVIHVGEAVRIDARQKRHHVREIGEIVPGELDAGRLGHGDEMQRVIGRAAGGVEADDAVDDHALVDDLADRRELVAERGDGERPLGRQPGQLVAERRARIDEGRARHMQAHDLHQHLVGVGGAVEGAGARPVIGGAFCLEQLGAAELALGVELADARLLAIRQAGGHRAGRDEHRRHMAEGKRRDQQARHDLVADAEIDRGVEHVVRHADGRGHGDGVAREQRQLHAGLALGDAVAHRRHAARHLGDAAGGACRLADQLGIGLVGLVRREHVVVGGDDAEIGHHVALQRRLVLDAAGGEAMREVAAGERPAPCPPFAAAAARRSR